METKVVAVRNWDDLVFDSRNKEYGAYSLRQAYLRRLFLGLGLSTSIIILMLFMPRLFPGKSIIPAIPEVKWKEIKISDLPFIEPREKPKSTAAARAPRSNNLNRTILVVKDSVESVPENDNIVLTSSNQDDEVIGGFEGEGDVALPVDPPIVNPKVHTWVEMMPSYEGGLEGMMKFIKKKLHYPISARRQEIEGTVVVSFVVNGDGTITDVTVLRGIHRDCDDEAIRVISLLPGWTGGKQNGSPVAVRMALPIKFSLTK
jgi:periplasmic protein TonB